jgi:carbonic anhydrase/acetyltransferase-like protein (isoleucine patch superfamily)
MPSRGDTVVGNDVWFGYRATVMPGVRIGDGAIIAAIAGPTAASRCRHLYGTSRTWISTTIEPRARRIEALLNP